MRITRKNNRDYLIKALLTGMFFGVLLGVAWNVAEARETFIDPTEVSKDGIIQSIMSHKTFKVEKPTLEAYRAYIKTIFGGQARIAFAVFENECNHTRSEWPICVNKWARGNRGESSIGPAQINLWAHGAKVPGKDEKDKELWLSDWHNSILMAYRVYRESGWEAWTAYTSKNYLKNL